MQNSEKFLLKCLQDSKRFRIFATDKDKTRIQIFNDTEYEYSQQSDNSTGLQNVSGWETRNRRHSGWVSLSDIIKKYGQETADDVAKLLDVSDKIVRYSNNLKLLFPWSQHSDKDCCSWRLARDESDVFLLYNAILDSWRN